MTDPNTCCKSAVEHSDGSLTIASTSAKSGSSCLSAGEVVKRAQAALDKATDLTDKITSVDSVENLKVGFLIAIADKWLGVASKMGM